MSVYVTYNGGAHWLECFPDDVAAEHGAPFHPISAGDSWDTLVAKVAAHRAEHGCEPSGPTSNR